MSTPDDITKLHDRLAEARRHRDRAEGVRDSAQAAVDRARKELADDFACDNVEQAEKLLAAMTDDLNELVADINAQLDRIGL